MPISPLLPLPFYLCIVALAVLGWYGWKGRSEGWGIPMLVVVGTAASWYLGDPLYNSYEEYVRTQGEEPLTNALWEVLLFFIALGIWVPIINQKMNGDLEPRSQIFQMMRNLTIDTDRFQHQVTFISRLLLGPWLFLMIIALLRTDFDLVGIFFPYLGEGVAEPWSRGRLGGGIDALYSLASYVQLMLTALIGVAFVLSKRANSMALAGTLYFISLPFFVFGRTRNAMIAVLLPAFMAFVTFRVRGGIIVKLAVVILGFMSLEGWMKFVIDNRDRGSMVGAMKSGGTQDERRKSRKHLGFNMLEELGYINYFIDNGAYKVNWGTRYLAELANPIPRVIWPGKPEIGTDYAVARGMSYGAAASSGGIAATVSTGMIGQGVVNFGRILGPIAAALLMAIWVAVLARQDLMGHDIGHLLLYAIGLVLTFNMGRDVTVLVLYPFIFGWLLLWWNKRRKKAES
jgi:hypothetical protein